MNFSQLISERYSCRNFTNTPAEDAKLAAVLEAGRVAPTACNKQPQRIKIIQGGDLAKVDACTTCRFNAQTVLLVCYDGAVCWKREHDGALSGDVDASIVTTQMMLAAKEQGLDTCWVMWFDPAKTRELFNLAENIVPVAFLPIGYAADSAKPSPQHTDKHTIDEILLK